MCEKSYPPLPSACILLPATTMNQKVRVYTAIDINETEFFMPQNTQGIGYVCLEYFINIFWQHYKIFIIFQGTSVSITR